MDDIVGDPTHRVRPRLVTLAALLIAFSGALDILYAPLVVLAPFFDRPTPDLMTVLGAVSIAAAIGVWRVQRWGRVLGAGACLFGIAQTLTALGASLDNGEPLDLIPLAVVSLTWTAALAGLPLWVLLRRWLATD